MPQVADHPDISEPQIDRVPHTLWLDKIHNPPPKARRLESVQPYNHTPAMPAILHFVKVQR